MFSGKSMPIRTERLDLLPGTRAVLEADLEGRNMLERTLHVEIPESWPPPLYDADAIGWMLERLAADQGSGAWGFRYFVHQAEAPAQGRAVGAGDFKGPPSPDGSVEVGYSVLPEFQRRGFATEALKGLMARAYDDPRVDHILAETLPELTPSIGVLHKAGFMLVGPGSEQGVIRFEHRRATDG
jgi:RimJ/RimL family protein N-acetyltransferase